MSAILRINLENKSAITTPPSGYISLFAGADTTPISAATNEHLSVINAAGTLLRVPYLEENLTVATGYNFQQSVDISGSVWVGTDHTVVSNTILGTTCTNTLLVNATSTFNCPVTFNGGFSLSGDTTFCGDIMMCGCPKPAGMTGDTATTVPTLYVNKISACTGTLSINNDVDICGNLDMCGCNNIGVTATTTASTAVTITYKQTTLKVAAISGCSGTLTVGSDLYVSGTTYMTGDLNLCRGITGVTNTIYTSQISGCSSITMGPEIDVIGDVVIVPPASGIQHRGMGSATQITSLETEVIVNATTGRVTLFTGTDLLVGESKTFSIENTTVKDTSLVLITLQTPDYVEDDSGLVANIVGVAAGRFNVNIRNPWGQTAIFSGVQKTIVNFMVINL